MRIKFAQQMLLLVLVTRRFVFLCIAKRATVNGVNSNALILQDGFVIVYTTKKHGGIIWTLFSFRRNKGIFVSLESRMEIC